jgi:predicted DNA-binding protein (MmcQ/YjbR family)
MFQDSRENFHHRKFGRPAPLFQVHLRKLAELIEREDIHPAPYVGRYKWVMLERLDALPDRELKDLIGHSYEMVEAAAPKKKKARSRTKKLLLTRSKRKPDKKSTKRGS